MELTYLVQQFEMSHCRTAAGANGHDHHDHGHSHDHEHDHSDDITPALQHSLYEHIRFDDIVTLNEAETHSGKGIVKKTWSERLQPFPVLQSDTDAQLLINIPYVMVCLHIFHVVFHCRLCFTPRNGTRNHYVTLCGNIMHPD